MTPRDDKRRRRPAGVASACGWSLRFAAIALRAPDGLVAGAVKCKDGAVAGGGFVGRDRRVERASAAGRVSDGSAISPEPAPRPSAAQFVSQYVASVLARRARWQAARVGLADLDESVRS